MSKNQFLFAFLCFGLFAVSCNSDKQHTPEELTGWENFAFPEVIFSNHAEGTKGWEIYSRIVPDPVDFIQQHALRVAQIIFWTADDQALPDVQTIQYDFVDQDGVSWKWGDPPHVGIGYTSRWVESFWEQNGQSDSAILFETRGILYHELLHVYQAQPRGVGVYANGPGPDLINEFWIFTEGLADGVRAYAGFLPPGNRRLGGSWRDGYQTTGFFLKWLTTKDSDFLRKFNYTAYHFERWSFDIAMEYIFGEGTTTDTLWRQYQLYLVGLQGASEQ
ncbi:MAG: basic secretory family protein [Bacteroidales bacterium]|nr:basic secretory family protein [Bacteroidales bacterium]